MILFVYGLWETDKYIRGACVHVCMCTLMQKCTRLFTVQEIAFQVPSQTGLVKPDLRILVV